jgi:glycogen operon protein
MTEDEWNTAHVRCLGMLLNGQAMDEYDERGNRIKDDVLLLLINGYWEPITFKLPGKENEPDWTVLVDTHREGQPNQKKSYSTGNLFQLEARSLVLLCQNVT